MARTSARSTFPGYSSFPGYSRAALTFLEQIVTNNNREWFLARKALYDTELRGATVALVEALNARLVGFAPEYVTEPAKAVPRIYRDLRFSEDRRPYKHNVAAVFPYHDGKGRPADRKPGERNACGSFYVSVSAEGVEFVAGVQRPLSAFMTAIRSSIAGDPATFRRVLKRRAIVNRFGELEGPRLVHVPRGYPADHPAADLLRLKQYCLRAELPVSLANSSKLLPELARLFRAAVPFVALLDSAVSTTS